MGADLGEDQPGVRLSAQHFLDLILDLDLREVGNDQFFTACRNLASGLNEIDSGKSPHIHLAFIVFQGLLCQCERVLLDLMSAAANTRSQ